MKLSKTKNSGFSLIELLVVISIISLLSSVVISKIYVARERARITAGFQFASQASRVAGDELAASWELNDGSGSTVKDSSGFGSNGTIAGTVSWSPESPDGLGNGSLYLDGINTQVAIPFSSRFQPTKSLSAGAWIKAVDTTPVQKVFSNTATGGYAISFGDAVCPEPSFCAMIRVGGTYYAAKTSPSNIKVGKWHHVFMTYDGETLILYIDGRKAAVNEAPSGPLFYTYASEFCIGSELGNNLCDGARYFKGNISGVRIYAKSLTASNVQRLFASEYPKYFLASK